MAHKTHAVTSTNQAQALKQLRLSHTFSPALEAVFWVLLDT